ncbi:cache domain-containing protein [Desulfamplus magnetovallimortis]|nr:cache domain-containing protein [Desulfamplus magnetovallimortis]
MKLSREINLFIIGSMVILGTLCAGVSTYSLYYNSKAEMEHLSNLLLSERKNNLRDLVAGAYSVLATANFYEPAQNALSDMRFGENNQNHFFVVDTDGMFWVYPENPDFLGKVKMDLSDAEGTPYIQQIINGATSSGEGVIQYKEMSEGSNGLITRLVHYKYFEKWKWVVCAGMSINDIEHVLAQKEKELEKSMLRQLVQISVMLLAALAISTLFSAKMISRRVVAPLLAIKDAAESIGQGNFNNTIEVKGGQEIRQLAKSILRMQNSLEISLKMTKQMKEQQKIRSLKNSTQTINSKKSDLKKTDLKYNVADDRKIHKVS